MQNNFLEKIAYPISEQVFLNKVIGNKSFFLKGTIDKFADLFSLSQLYQALEYGERESPKGYRLSKFIHPHVNSIVPTTTSEEIGIFDIGNAIDEGHTVCVTHLEKCDAEIDVFVRGLKNTLNFFGTVNVNCYLSPDGSGANLHFDSRLGFVLQIEGRKKWNYCHDSDVKWPKFNAQIDLYGNPVWMGPVDDQDLKGIQGCELQEIVLEPGDLLCIPAGAWHSAKAIDYSLALTIGFKPYSFSEILLPMIDEHFQMNSSWQAGLIPFKGTLDSGANSNLFEDNWNHHIDSVAEYLKQLKMNPQLYTRLKDSF